MSPYMQNPDEQVRGARNRLCGWMHHCSVARDWLTQMRADPFYMLSRMAGDMAQLCFGERCRND